MEIIILTGMSGAGKSLAANYLEDMGFFCIDNLPPDLLPGLIDSFARNSGSWSPDEEIRRMAFVMDVRGLSLFDGIFPALGRLDQMAVDYRIIFLDAADHVLLSRYKQSRRNHPLAQGQGIVEAIALERTRLSPIRDLADDVIDTSNLTPNDFRNLLYGMFSVSDRDERMTILIQSFGFKYGVPLDCDNIIDVRFIPNPYYIEELKLKSGLDEAVRRYVMSFEESNKFMAMQEEIFEYAIPFYIREGKVRLTIGVGCTGGRHRSVVLAEDLANRLRDNNLRVVIDHRDIEKDTRYRSDADEDKS
ncbi:MAG: RNase adapter RapZ [Saccharofermentanales bacterium]|jgi:UPF0042 nucleotide-binding protein|nr:RNase adapter RapZ [Clostridiaceae bacterium]